MYACIFADLDASLAELREKYTIVDSCFYVNPPHLKSILDVEHAHICIQVSAEDDHDYEKDGDKDKDKDACDNV